MTMQLATVGVGAVIGGRFNSAFAGLGRAVGMGVPGPWGDMPKDIAAGTYEITGTLVALRKNPGVNEEELGRFNQVESAPNIIAGTPDQISFNGDTGDAGGLRWAYVTVKTGPLAGETGYVAMKYMGPVGWTASHGGTGPAPGPAPAPAPTPEEAVAKKTNYVPWIIGGVVLTGLVVGGAIMKKKRGGMRLRPRVPSVAAEARRRRRRYR